VDIVSVQYDQAPHLTLEQQDAVQREYDARAKDPTTAFLLCYFLGLVGAHRLYLGQWGAATLRLLLPLTAVALAILGVLDVLPFATFSLAVIAILCGLVWEALDLVHLDQEVNTTNSALMDHLFATSVPAGGYASPDPRARPAQPEPQPADMAAADAGVAVAALMASADPGASLEPQNEPPNAAPVEDPVAETETLTLEPDVEEPLPDPGVLSHDSADAISSAFPPTASAYVPPVAPEIITGEFAAPSADPPTPPLWPGALDDRTVPDAPVWPGVAEAQPSSTSVAPPPAPEPEQPEAPRLKRIRVRRKILLDDGTVVGEQVLEDFVPVEMDTQEAARALEARSPGLTREEIAKLANLPPGTDLQLKRE
jgi:hypothetical protein